MCGLGSLPSREGREQYLATVYNRGLTISQAYLQRLLLRIACCKGSKYGSESFIITGELKQSHMVQNTHLRMAHLVATTLQSMVPSIQRSKQKADRGLDRLMESNPSKSHGAAVDGATQRMLAYSIAMRDILKLESAILCIGDLEGRKDVPEKFHKQNFTLAPPTDGNSKFRSIIGEMRTGRSGIGPYAALEGQILAALSEGLFSQIQPTMGPYTNDVLSSLMMFKKL